MIIGVVPLLALYWMYNSCNLTYYRHNHKLCGYNFFALNIIFFLDDDTSCWCRCFLSSLCCHFPKVSLQHQLPTGDDENNDSIVIDSTMVCDYKKSYDDIFLFSRSTFSNGKSMQWSWLRNRLASQSSSLLSLSAK